MEIRPNRSNETQFLPGSDRIDTAIWMHYMDSNKTADVSTMKKQCYIIKIMIFIFHLPLIIFYYLAFELLRSLSPGA